jgi:hypothetical protein
MFIHLRTCDAACVVLWWQGETEPLSLSLAALMEVYFEKPAQFTHMS